MNFEDILHDQVTLASAGSYSAEMLRDNGLRLDVNLSDKKVRSVGSPIDPVFPEVIIWMPNSKDSNEGKAVIVESIETENSINYNLNKWRKLASLGVVFQLVVPSNCRSIVESIIRENGLENKVGLQSYFYENNRYQFS